jgi:hypothetical protein
LTLFPSSDTEAPGGEPQAPGGVVDFPVTCPQCGWTGQIDEAKPGPKVALCPQCGRPLFSEED